MSFGLLKHFKDLKKGPSSEKQKTHFRHIIIGQDLGAVLKLMDIRREHPEESVRIVTSRPLSRQTLIESAQYGVSTLRTEASVHGIYKKFFNAKIMPEMANPQFYKDGKFHDFKGRAKSMELLTGESFFTEKGHRLEIASLFAPEDWEKLDQVLNECQDIRIFESIEKTVPQDLAEPDEWTLNFRDYQKFSCEFLYVSISPKKFLNLLSHKESLSPELIDFCTSLQVQSGLSVTWKMKKVLFPEERTLFIPQSMTHEWGHFIVQFENDLCHALFLIHEEEPQTEDLAGKIRLLKRVLDRVFPDIEKFIGEEFIRFDDEMFISNQKENLLEQIGFDYPSLKFLGQSAPLPQHPEEKFLARTLLS